jgi:S1-C subfamily serine protease
LSRSNVKPVVAALALAALFAAVAVGGGPRTPAVVTVRVLQPGGSAELATGTVVGPGRVQTVAHVVRGGERIEDLDGRGVRRRATLARARAGRDLALLVVPGATGPAVRHERAAGPLSVLLRRDGATSARPAELRRRIVADLVDQPGRPRREALELGARILPGDSGAPVVDGDGDVVGVVFARSTRRDGVAYAVRTDVAGALP